MSLLPPSKALGKHSTGASQPLLYSVSVSPSQPSGFSLVAHWLGGSFHSSQDAGAALLYWEKKELNPELCRLIREAIGELEESAPATL